MGSKHFGVAFSKTVSKCVLLCGFIGATAPAMASGGNVLSSSAQPLGYSLSTLAADTAVYNTGVNVGSPSTPPPPSIPFETLVSNDSFAASKYIYVPIFFADNSAPVDPNFPASITNQQTDATYLDQYLLANYNVSALLVQVDGVNTVLNDSYIVGVNTPTLLDGSPGGNEYITSAVVLSPLSAGAHTVAFGGLVNGQPKIFGSYSVTAIPEPGLIGLAGVAGISLLRRRRRSESNNRSIL